MHPQFLSAKYFISGHPTNPQRMTNDKRRWHHTLHIRFSTPKDAHLHAHASTVSNLRSFLLTVQTFSQNYNVSKERNNIRDKGNRSGTDNQSFLGMSAEIFVLGDTKIAQKRTKNRDFHRDLIHGNVCVTELIKTSAILQKA